ncbi:MAG: pyrimidine 5'-nucleotidase [Hyphomonas sp.]|jgi:putative hydrolase of the HAD superfamily
MKPASAPSLGHVADWVFDLDNTLYPAECDLFAEIDVRMTDFVARLTGLARDEARRLQKHYYATYGTTLAGLMAEHGLDPADFLHYVHEIDLSPLPDLPALRSAIAALPGRKFIYTNGPRRHAERVTEKMGLAHLFNASFGIEDSAYTPKPNLSAYQAFCRVNQVIPEGAAFFEDLARNLLPAKTMGFTTILVHSTKDWSHEPAEARPAGAGHRFGGDGDGHIDYITGDLAGFLQAAVDLTATKKD